MLTTLYAIDSGAAVSEYGNYVTPREKPAKDAYQRHLRAVVTEREQSGHRQPRRPVYRRYT
jgi:hypothetical protein